MNILDWLVEDDSTWPDFLSGSWHHMGTTRMHEDPTQGVVDPNCKVHGLGNLYVAGPGVYPTAGAATPTLTLIALTLRLSDYVVLLLDTFNDNENGLAFGTSPTGLRTDVAVSGDATGNVPLDIDWDTFWNVEVSQTPEGWFAEMRIPVSSLRFQTDGGRRKWG